MRLENLQAIQKELIKIYNSGQTIKERHLGISHINNDWCWTYEADDGTIAVRKLKWWERILYWKFPDKSSKVKF